MGRSWHDRRNWHDEDEINEEQKKEFERLVKKQTRDGLDKFEVVCDKEPRK